MKIQSLQALIQLDPSIIFSIGFISRTQKGLVRKNEFRESFGLIIGNSSFHKNNFFLTFYLWYPLFSEFFSSFTKIGGTMKQLNLIPLETLPLRVKYDVLFEPLPSLSLNPKERGRPPFSRDALLKAFIYKALRRLKTLSDLAFEFLNNPMMSQAVGFNPYQDPPTVERFSKFLRETPHPLLQQVRILLVQKLLDESILS